MATKSVKSLSKQLAGVAKQAKSLGINTSKADAMVKQTKREGSKSFSGSSEEKAYNDSIITSQNLTPNTPINIPEPKVTDVPDYLANYVGLTGGETGMSVSGSTLSVDPVKDTATSDPYAGIMQAFLDNNKSIEDNRTTAEEIQRKVEKESGIKKYREEANNLSGQLNTITASRDAAVLSLEGQGRGQTAGFIGGEQARINREAAIKALPIQAQLATAQGNVALAQDHINTWGKILMDDATNEYNNQKATNLSIFSYLNDAEKRRLDVIQKADDRAYAEQTNNINYQRSLASEAASYGLGGVSASILKLDPKSATFNQDIAGLQSRVMKPVVASGPAKRDTQFDKDGNLVDMQTGEILSQAGGGAIDDQKQQQIGETLSLARELLKDDGEWMSGKQSAVGASLAKLLPFGMSLGLQGNRTAFENKVNTLKANLTLDNLSLLKGPMSDKDLAFLQAIGSSISTNMSEKEFNGQVKKVIQKLEEKVAPVSLNGGRVITAPDGLQIEIID